MSRSRPASNPVSYHKHTKQYYVTRSGKRVYLGSDKEEAVKKYHKLGLELILQEPTPPEEITIKELANRFIVSQQANWRSAENTLKSYQQWLGHFIQDHPQLSDKKDTSRLGLDDVISQIRKRYELYDKNIYDIELNKCFVISSILAIESARGGVVLDSKETYGLNKNISEFYQQQRDERVNLWRDVSRLRLQLPENAQQYLSAYRKVSILEDDKGDTI